MDISVIICTHNRAELLREMLAALFKAEFPGDIDIEIIAIANACHDDTADVLAQHQEAFRAYGRNRFRWLTEPIPGKSVALNIAIQESQGDALCFIDDDQFIDTAFFKILSNALRQHQEYEIFCGKLEPDWDGSEPAWVHESGKYHIGIRPFPEYNQGNDLLEIRHGHKLPSGGNIIVRRSVFARSGTFSTDFGPQGHNLMGGEDLEFLRRAIKSGARILYIPSLRQKHAIEKERMATLYMMRKSYLRTLSSIVTKNTPPTKLQPYLLWKPTLYFFAALSSINKSRRFYYLIRLAAAFGELRGAFIKIFAKQT